VKRIGPMSVAGAVVLSFLVGVPALRADDRPANRKATFTATATAGLRLEGTSDALSAAWEVDTLVVTLPTASFHTGIELRDKHLREHIEADKYPTAALRVPLTAIRLPAPGASASGTAQAPLSFHGQVKPVSFTWQASRSDGFDVSGALELDFTAFGVPVPTYLGISVKPPAGVSVHFHVPEPPSASVGAPR
jgi:polyisoprenoid-binding protein YceI